MNNILSCLEGVRTVIIAGHTRPDGDSSRLYGPLALSQG